MLRPPYHPRDTQGSVVVQLLHDHLDAFLARLSPDGQPATLPAFVERQLRAMQTCGDLTLGFLRLECSRCRGPRVVPFSCKARLCGCCAGRRMNEQAAHLVDRVLPRAPYRQWVLTLPWDLARAVAYDPTLCARVFAIFAEEVAAMQRARAKAAGVAHPQAGSVLEIQRFADGAKLWPHGHLLAPDGVFLEADDGSVRFHGVGPPRDRDVHATATRVAARVIRLLRRRAASPHTEDDGEPDPRQLLLQLSRGPVDDEVTLEGSGGAERPKPARSSKGKRLCARTPEGFELHAATRVPAADRKGLERLCRYLARPALSSDRLRRLDDGRIELTLKRTWKGGVRALVFEPLTFIARMAALIPPPRMQMRRFYGVFSSHHHLRARVVPEPPDPRVTGRPVAPARPARMAWSELLRRVWGIDGLRCPHCGGRMFIVAAVRDPDAVTAILAAVQASTATRHETAPRGPPPGRCRRRTTNTTYGHPPA